MPSLNHFDDFRRSLRTTRALLARQQQFYATGSLPVSELEAIFELSYLKVFTKFENELIEVFKTNLLMDRGSDGKRRALYRASNRESAERLLRGANRFVSLLPFEQLGSVDVHFSQSMVAAIEMKAEKLVSVLQ